MEQITGGKLIVTPRLQMVRKSNEVNGYRIQSVAGTILLSLPNIQSWIMVMQHYKSEKTEGLSKVTVR